jgi:hypothetical protein
MDYYRILKKLKNTNFTAQDKYLLKIENHSYSSQLYEEYSQLFDKIKSCRIYIW